MDDGIRNGTFVGGVRLSPRAPRALKDGDLVRVGRVWLEIRIDPAAPPEQDLPTATRDLALALVSQAMRGLGDDTVPRVCVVEGVTAGAALLLEEEGRAYVVGRGDRCDLLLDEPDASREHVQLVRRGSVVLVRDLGSKNGAWLGDGPVEPGRDVVWRPALMLRIGATVLALDEPVARALAELEAMADEPIAPEDVPPAPPARSSRSSKKSSAAGAANAEVLAGGGAADDARRAAGHPSAPVAELPGRDPRSVTTAATRPHRRAAAWSSTDAAVVVLAVVVLAASVTGLVWLLRG
jgi:hypothetical protein